MVQGAPTLTFLILRDVMTWSTIGNFTVPPRASRLEGSADWQNSWIYCWKLVVTQAAARHAAAQLQRNPSNTGRVAAGR